MTTTPPAIPESIALQAGAMAALRRDLHAHPERCFEEVRTADLVAQQLHSWGIAVHRGLGTTGVVGTVHGRDGGASGRAVGLRADMDALPMQEFNTFAHASRHQGKMHACGHDGHTAMLLAAAQHLAQHRDFDGTVYLIFQPAEEGGGGAREMIKDGLFERFPMEAVFGMHNWPGMPAGTFAVSPGPVMGSSNEFRIVAWDGAARAVTSAHGTGQAVADPRGGVDPAGLHGKWHVTPWSDSTRAVIAGSTSGEGAVAVADPRPNMKRGKGDAYLTGGHYGVVSYDDPAGAVSASACHDNGPWSVADPRAASGFSPGNEALPSPNDKLVCRIEARDGTWHRPFTTLELACLQSFIDPEEYFSPAGPASRGERFVLDGQSDQRWREAIGNAVPRKSAKAIGTVMGQTILLARNGETFVLGSTPIWVRPMVAALAVAREGGVA